jgi:MFS family permease
MYKQILRNRSLMIMGIAESVSNVGNWITMMAVFSLIVFKGGGNEVQSSAVFLTGLLPTLIFSPVAGWLSDRFDRKWLMIVSELTSGLIISGVIFSNRLEFIYGLLVLQAISTSIMTPARQASVPQVVSRDELIKANAFLQQLAGMIKIGAPILAGALLAVMNPHTAIILDVVSFALSAIVLSRLPSLPPAKAPQPAAAARQGQAPAAPVQTLMSVLKESWYLRFLFILAFLAIIVFIGFDVLSSIFIRDVLEGEAGLYGISIGLVGLGTVGGTFLLMAQKGQAHPWRDLIAGLALLALIPATLALVIWLGQPGLGRIMLGISCLLGGVGNGFINVQASTLLQLLTPPALLGRIGGVFQSTLVAGQLLGLLMVPILVPAVLSMGLYFAISAGVVLLLVLYATLALRKAPHSSDRVSSSMELDATQSA